MAHLDQLANLGQLDHLAYKDQWVLPDHKVTPVPQGLVDSLVFKDL